MRKLCKRKSAMEIPMRIAALAVLLPLTVFAAPTTQSTYDYGSALAKSILFYDAQRSGVLPDNSIPWRGDSATLDGAAVGQDLSGGWYQDGNHVKYTYPTAAAITNLAWGILEFKSGYEKAGQLGHAQESLKWGLAYLLKCVSEDDRIIAVVGNVSDSEWLRPEDMYNDGASREVQYVTIQHGTDLASEIVAAMAAGSMVFRGSDDSFADQLEAKAIALEKQIRNKNQKQRYSNNVETQGKYNSQQINGYLDELVWSNIWLYQATGKKRYYWRAKKGYPNQLNNNHVPHEGFTWDDKTVGMQILLCNAMTNKKHKYCKAVQRAICAYSRSSLCTSKQVKSWMLKPHTPGGLVKFNMPQSLMKSGNAAFISFIAAKSDIISKDVAVPFGQSQVDYMLGSSGRSHMVGFGTNPPQFVHHRGASCAAGDKCDNDDYISPQKNPNELTGAVVGDTDGHSDNWQDSRHRADTNQPFIEQNAGWQGAIAALLAEDDYVDETTTLVATTTLASTTEKPDVETCADTEGFQQALQKSILFYDAQRSGEITDTRVPWRKNSCMNDGKSIGEDLAGGWYQDGNHVKYTFPAAFTTTMLAWGLLEFPEGYDQAGEMQNALNSLKWGLDYLVKCKLDDDRVVAVVGDISKNDWMKPEAIPQQGQNRPVQTVDFKAGERGTDLVAEMVAALAAGSMVFRKTDSTYADSLLTKAIELCSLVDNYSPQGSYSQTIHTGGNYDSNEHNYFVDELAWMRLWLHKATGEQSFLDEALDAYPEEELTNVWNFPYHGLTWDDKTLGVQMLLYSLLTDGDSLQKFGEKIKQAMCVFTDEPCDSGLVQEWMKKKYTNGGMIKFDQKQGLMKTGNAAFLALMAVKVGIMEEEAKHFALQQVEVILGSESKSHMVGFGQDYAKYVYHRGASCKNNDCNWNDYNLQSENPHIIEGAIVGDILAIEDTWVDSRYRPDINQPFIEQNAGWHGAFAGLIHLLCGGTTDPSGTVSPGIDFTKPTVASTTKTSLGTTTSTQSTNSEFTTTSPRSTTSTGITSGATTSATEPSTSESSSTHEPTTPNIKPSASTDSAISTSTSTSSPDTTTVASCPNTAKYDYGEALGKSILFYEAQRSGELPSTNRVSWRKSAFAGDSDNGHDLSGGWHDAGDYVKFNLPMAAAVTNLAWGLLEFKEGYEKSGELNNMLDSIKWPLDYFIKCHVSVNQLYAQVGDANYDHSYWLAPEEMDQNVRPAYKLDSSKPGSDVAGEMAAALAAATMVFESTDPTYAAELLTHARQIYDFGKTFQGKYTDNGIPASPFYTSSGYKDELAWAAIWLYKATKENHYLNDAKSFYNECCSNKGWALSWDSKKEAVQLLMHLETNENSYKQPIAQYLNDWMTGNGIDVTPKGLSWRLEWGSLRYAANTALLALIGHKNNVFGQNQLTWAKSQIDYALGDHGRSLVVGFGNNPPKRVHHSAASVGGGLNGWDAYHANRDNPYVLEGALVGGPDKYDNYLDDRTNYYTNEVACDYNAGFQSALAALRYFECRGDL